MQQAAANEMGMDETLASGEALFSEEVWPSVATPSEAGAGGFGHVPGLDGSDAGVAVLGTRPPSWGVRLAGLRV